MSSSSDLNIDPPRTSKAGRYIVFSMFGLGLTATGLLFLYWNLHLMPFMPLQEAIVAEFEGSAPRVEGGQRKMHRDSPTLLRIVMKVDFDPTENSPKTIDSLEHRMARLKDLASQHVQTSDYRMLEVHFYHLVKEKDVRERVMRRDFSTWQDLDADGNVINSRIDASSELESASDSSALPSAGEATQQE